MNNNIINFDEYYYLEDDFQKLKELASKSYINLIYSNFKGISILEPLSSEITKDLIYILNYYQEANKNISVFTINTENEERIVLRRINPENWNVDTNILEQRAETLYQSGNYEEAADIYLKLLEGKDDPQAYVYLRLGQLFPDFGLDYFIIATALADNPKQKENYQNILNDYKNNHQKPNYNIDNFDEILDFIGDSELNVEDSCLCLGMNREQTDIVKLKIARIYFTNKHYDKGEEFIRSVESSDAKTDNVKNLLKEVVSNKKIYSNDTDIKTLSLKLKPGKPIHYN